MKALLIWPVLPNSLAGKMYLSSQNFDDRIFLKKPFNFLNLVDLLCYRENYQPDDIAFTFLSNGEAEEVSLTYQELGKRARAIATVLQSTKARGERALLLYQPGLEFIEAFFAVLLDTWYATKDLMLFIESLKRFTTVRSKTIAKLMTPVGSTPINGLIPSVGVKTNSRVASDSKSKAFPKTTRCRVSGLRCPPTARTSSLLTIWLQLQLRQHNRRVASVGRLNNCIERANR